MRPEFVASLRHAVVPTLALFAWWRDANLEAIVDAITGPPRCHASVLAQRTHRSPSTVPDARARAERAEGDQARTNPRRWLRRRM
jgi:hypothetical protein